MFTILLIALICYMCFVVYKTRKNMLIEEKKKEKGSEPVERPVYWCPRKNRPIGREQERITVPTKEITLEKDVANIYDLVASSIQMNLGEEEKTLEQDKEVAKEVEYAEDFHHAPASEAVYDILFPSDEDIPEELLEYEETFLELEQLPIPLETEHIVPIQQGVSGVDDMNLVKWTVKVIGREQGLTRVLNMSDNKRYWIHTEGEILPENKLMYIELEVDSPYSYTLVGWSDRQLGSI
ncbi:transposase (plasmid) [Bacillus mycoides]|uniref:transposase n=1 Tax=Bacillus TaxID=1386 RepID=UPI00191263AB|nr:MULTISPECIES: transposase [Bacillus]MBK5490962.1 transposase [Bacillus sp. TH17]QWG70338.1 transposase [Bacillus mycoides]